MQFGKKLPRDSQTIFQKNTNNSRTFGKKLQHPRNEPSINRDQQYKNALFPEELKNLPQRSQLER